MSKTIIKDIEDQISKIMENVLSTGKETVYVEPYTLYTDTDAEESGYFIKNYYDDLNSDTENGQILNKEFSIKMTDSKFELTISQPSSDRLTFGIMASGTTQKNDTKSSKEDYSFETGTLYFEITDNIIKKFKDQLESIVYYHEFGKLRSAEKTLYKILNIDRQIKIQNFKKSKEKNNAKNQKLNTESV